MQPLSFGRQPAFNRFGFSRRIAAPAPTKYGDLVSDPDQVLARITAQHNESRRPVSVQLAYVACNALSASQQRIVEDALAGLLDADRLGIRAGGFVPVSSGGAS